MLNVVSIFADLPYPCPIYSDVQTLESLADLFNVNGFRALSLPHNLLTGNHGKDPLLDQHLVRSWGAQLRKPVLKKKQYPREQVSRA